MTIEAITTFVIASSLLALAPGPDNLFVLTQSALYGRKAGILITLGLCTGLIVHTTAVALGLAVIFQTSELAVTLLKIVGAAYLLYLARQAFFAHVKTHHNEQQQRLSSPGLYGRGIIMNLTNPKVSLFFLAFLPQFISLKQDSTIILQTITLGILFILVTLVIFSGIAVLSGALSSQLNSSAKSQIYLNRSAAMVLTILAIRLLYD